MFVVHFIGHAQKIISAEDRLPGEGEYKLAQAVAGFLGKHMET